VISQILKEALVAKTLDALIERWPNSMTDVYLTYKRWYKLIGTEVWAMITWSRIPMDASV
jgi:hypothetical protein